MQMKSFASIYPKTDPYFPVPIMLSLKQKMVLK